MSSGTDSSPRPMPRLARLWDGQIEPLNKERLASDVDVVFLAVPENAAADLAPGLVSAGVRVIDLSGAFRIKDDGARSRWYPATKHLPDDAAYGLTEHYRDEVSRAALVANPGCYPTAALLALLPLAKAGLLDADAGVVIDAKSGISGAGKTPSDRTHFSENHGSVSAYGIFSHRHVAEMEQELGAAVTFVPHLVPLDRGILETIYVKVAARHDERSDRRRVRATLRRRAVRAADRRCAAGDQARRVDELLRHRLAARRRRAPARDRRVPRQPRQRRRRPGAAELQRRVRLRRTDGAAVTTASRLVLKLGGELLEPREDRDASRCGCRARSRRSGPLVVVHGGGRAIDAELARRGIVPKKVDGLRVTDAATLDVVVSVLAGTANTALVAALVGARRSGCRFDRRRCGLRPVATLATASHGFGCRRRILASLAIHSSQTRAPQLAARARLRARHRQPRRRSDGDVLNVNADVMACRVAACAAGQPSGHRRHDRRRVRRGRQDRRAARRERHRRYDCGRNRHGRNDREAERLPRRARRRRRQRSHRRRPLADGDDVAARVPGTTISRSDASTAWHPTPDSHPTHQRGYSNVVDLDRLTFSALESQHVLQIYRRQPVVFVTRRRRAGCIDDGGRAYLDFLSGIGVASLGHAHPGLARRSRRSGVDAAFTRRTCTSIRCRASSLPGCRRSSGSSARSSATAARRRSRRA